jgi:hypothetical protein
LPSPKPTALNSSLGETVANQKIRRASTTTGCAMRAMESSGENALNCSHSVTTHAAFSSHAFREHFVESWFIKKGALLELTVSAFSLS